MCIRTNPIPLTKTRYRNSIQPQYTASLTHPIQTCYSLQRVKLDTTSLQVLKNN